MHELVAKLKALANELGRTPIKHEFVMSGVSDYAVRNAGGFNKLLEMAGFEPYNGGNSRSEQAHKPKILVFDIETAPILAHVWGLFDQNIGLNQVVKDWHVLSWSAKWLGEKEVMYMDQRDKKNIEDDKEILHEIWKLLDTAEILISQNGIKFDSRKLNARFLHHGFPPPSSYRHIDTLRIAKKHFAFTSNKLAYMTDKFCTKYKKLTHGKFAGFELWKECIAGNVKAWDEMKKYNKRDVLALEELYLKLRAWDTTVNFNVFDEESMINKCSCGSVDFKKHDSDKTTNTGKFIRWICIKCGSERSEKINLLSKDKRKSLRN